MKWLALVSVIVENCETSSSILCETGEKVWKETGFCANNESRPSGLVVASPMFLRVPLRRYGSELIYGVQVTNTSGPYLQNGLFASKSTLTVQVALFGSGIWLNWVRILAQRVPPERHLIIVQERHTRSLSYRLLAPLNIMAPTPAAAIARPLTIATPTIPSFATLSSIRPLKLPACKFPGS